MRAVVGGGLVAAALLVAAVLGVQIQRSLASARHAAPAPASAQAHPSQAPFTELTPVPAFTPEVTDTPSPSPSVRPSPSPSVRPSPSPITGVTFQRAPLSARRGQRVNLVAITAPNVSCSIEVGYSGAPDLSPATSDDGGRVSWAWRVGGAAPTGTWPIVVTCGAKTATTQIVVS